MLCVYVGCSINTTTNTLMIQIPWEMTCFVYMLVLLIVVCVFPLIMLPGEMTCFVYILVNPRENSTLKGSKTA